MKKFVLAIALLLLGLAAQAQMKIHDDGHVSLGTLSGAWNVGAQFFPRSYHFNSLNTDPWNWVTIASPSSTTGKCWIVSYPGNKYDHRFFVTGEGYIFKRGSWRMADANLLMQESAVENAGAILDQITGCWYIPLDDDNSTREKKGSDLCIGVQAQDVERVLPVAVTADENGILYVDYDALTIILIETVKEQRREIETLRKVLENNGLLNE